MATAVHQERPFLPQPNLVHDDVLRSDDDATEISDLHLLKEVSHRMNLATRRPSTVQWKQVIEFRKSIGLYNSDVEPEYLDKIVEAQMKGTSPKTYTKRKKFIKNLEKKGEGDSAVEAEEEDKLNNNDRKIPKALKSKRSKWLSKDKRPHSEYTPKACEETIPAKSLPSPQTVKPPTNSPHKLPTAPKTEVATISNSNQNNRASPLAVDGKNHSDVIKELLSKKEASEAVCRFPLYDTDDDVEDDATGLSEMAVRYRNIDRALGKIRRDLITMRMEDNSLARKILDARSEINLIKVRQSCDAHAEMLDDVTYELEEEDLLPDFIKACDLPSRVPGSLMTAFSPLRTIGVSRMNINRRRFSIR